MSIKGLLAFIAIALPAGAASLKPIVIPLEPYVDEHWAFRARIKGKEQLFVMDTGGGLTVVTPETAAQLGCEPWGQLTGFRMRGDRLDLKRCDNVDVDAGGIQLHLPTTGIWDFNKLLPPGAPPIAASVGLDAFAGRAITLDIGNRRLTIETPSSLKARVAKAQEVPVQFVEEAQGYSTTVALALDTSKGRVWMHLDSGDDVPLTVGSHIAPILGLEVKKGAQPLDVRLAGGVPLRGSAYVKDLIFDGNIGAPIISKWIVTIDLARRRLWIAPAGAS
ncbi:MAG TPA: hypothetical protein VH083_22305 [Myxococcales bacterium]|nr:hypothetical protein [Myxococcales bacterium]